ncbi:MAG: AraC family transcriptional regulator, partial [Anaerolineae bacterium]|nr:AraC family transcriptional regulator [Anaerolineae bacterium]
DGQPIYWLAMALNGIESEAQGKRPGYEAVISRLMDVLFIMVMRSWIDQHETGEGGWLGALYEPYIGNVLHAIHGNPGDTWTIERLAQVAMMSRSNFIERFTRMVGEPPMKYLTRWRIQLATTWIGDDNTLTLEQIAHRLGYSSSFAFSKTFKRFMGIAPNHFKQMGKTTDSELMTITQVD